MTFPLISANPRKRAKRIASPSSAPLVQAKEIEVATVSRTSGGDGMKGDLGETETESNEASSEWEEERQKSRADEIRSRSLLRRSAP